MSLYKQYKDLKKYKPSKDTLPCNSGMVAIV